MLGLGIVRLNSRPWGVLGLLVVGASWPVLSGDLCGSARRGVGALWTEGLGVLTHRWVHLQTRHAQLVPQALAFHTMVTVWRGRGPLRDVLPDFWVALVARCSPVPP